MKQPDFLLAFGATLVTLGFITGVLFVGIVVWVQRDWRGHR
jgi:hypothetical protein